MDMKGCGVFVRLFLLSFFSLSSFPSLVCVLRRARRYLTLLTHNVNSQLLLDKALFLYVHLIILVLCFFLYAFLCLICILLYDTILPCVFDMR